MPRALLRSGEAREFQALGADGQPVYSAALPLRETIRLKLGTDAANCLALVQPSESGEHFDWYAPFEGDVIPWSSATDEERRDALAKLETLHRDLLSTAERMQADTANREKQIFARLLRKAVHFPGSEHVYLVDGKPVVTFWGFASQGADMPNPLLYLRPAESPLSAPPEPKVEPPPAPIPLAVKKSRWRLLWWLLPLLLLLLLLLFLLRACAPQVKLPFALNEVDLPGLPAVEVEDNKDKSITHRDLDGHGSVAKLPSDEDIAAADESAVNTPSAEDEALPDLPEEQPMEQNESEPEQAAPEQAAPESPEDTNPQNPLPEDASSQSQEKSQESAPLKIPPEALQNGSTDFLNGKWQAGAGIQDAQTGQPLRLDYEFENGQGEVRIQRGDGVECRGPVSATMQGDTLGINSQSQAHCSDGSRYSMPQVQCQPGDSGADCQSNYQNQRFPMSMRKNENGK